jgi:hypothetical protein
VEENEDRQTLSSLYFYALQYWFIVCLLVKRTYTSTYGSISRYAALAMTPVTMTPSQPRERGDGRWRAKQIRKGRDISKITKNNDPAHPLTLTPTPAQIEREKRELGGVTCSHGVHPNSESRAWILLNSPIHGWSAIRYSVLTSFFFLFEISFDIFFSGRSRTSTIPTQPNA